VEHVGVVGVWPLSGAGILTGAAAGDFCMAALDLSATVMYIILASYFK